MSDPAPHRTSPHPAPRGRTAIRESSARWTQPDRRAARRRRRSGRRRRAGPRPGAARPGARAAGAGARRTAPAVAGRRDARARRPRRGAAGRAPAADARRARPRPRGARAAAGSAWRRYARAHSPRARRVRPDARGPRRSRHRRASTACCSTSGSRRCSSTSPSAASPTRSDAPLDMRMDLTSGVSAADRLSTPTRCAELARVLREYGEERFALRIAQAIERERDRAPLTSTARLAELVRDAIPAADAPATGGHPAKRTFQALRIEVNGELDALRSAVPLGTGRGAGRWPDRRAVLPLARGSHRQAAPRRARRRPDAR